MALSFSRGGLGGSLDRYEMEPGQPVSSETLFEQAIVPKM